MDAKEGSNNFLIGILVGAASWLPGISGGVVAVLFGVYERLIDDVNNIRTKIKEDFWFLVTLMAGIIIGLLIIVYIIDYMMSIYLMITMFFFVGLIIGQLPDLVRITKRGEPTKRSHAVWLAIGFAVMMLLLFTELYVIGDSEEVIEDSGLIIGMTLSFIAGAVYAVSKIVPGISGATVMLVLGLYVWMNTIIKQFDLVYLLPFGIGFIIAVFAFAKVMGYILKNHHHAIYYFIIGLTVGSIVVILALTDVGGLADVAIGCAAAAVGIVISMALSMIKRRPAKGAQGA
ncbi:MAG: DUF368 domain-containing protein [Methanomassiliicoccaceae archaeon]|jgi:putative membrane protein|nr:DUF368 domain-containing protein [Methanomassiliicoccaceae archaeon]